MSTEPDGITRMSDLRAEVHDLTRKIGDIITSYNQLMEYELKPIREKRQATLALMHALRMAGDKD